MTEDKLFHFDNKLKELEVMVSLFESKLNSLPSDITSKFPEMTSEKLGDFTNLTQINNVNNANINTASQDNAANSNCSQTNVNPQPPQNLDSNNNQIQQTTEQQQPEQNVTNQNNENVENNQNPEEEVVEETPQSKIDKLIDEDKRLERVYKAAMRKIPSYSLIPQARMSGVSEESITQLLDLYKQIDINYK